jgi:hypothetical protein
LKFRFIQETDSDLHLRPLCVVCFDLLSNDAIKPSKLERHFQSKLDLANKSVEYFERMRNDMRKQVITMKKNDN